jgi:hypothetical protein
MRTAHARLWLLIVLVGTMAIGQRVEAAAALACYRAQVFGVSDAFNLFGGAFSVGDIVTGCYAFDSATPLSSGNATSVTYAGAPRAFTFGTFGASSLSILA